MDKRLAHYVLVDLPSRVTRGETDAFDEAILDVIEAAFEKKFEGNNEGLPWAVAYLDVVVSKFVKSAEEGI